MVVPLAFVRLVLLALAEQPNCEAEQRHPADRALLDHPGDVAVALSRAGPRHERGDAEAEIDRSSGA